MYNSSAFNRHYYRRKCRQEVFLEYLQKMDEPKQQPSKNAVDLNNLPCEEQEGIVKVSPESFDSQ